MNPSVLIAAQLRGADLHRKRRLPTPSTRCASTLRPSTMTAAAKAAALRGGAQRHASRVQPGAGEIEYPYSSLPPPVPSLVLVFGAPPLVPRPARRARRRDRLGWGRALRCRRVRLRRAQSSRLSIERRPHWIINKMSKLACCAHNFWQAEPWSPPPFIRSQELGRRDCV